AKAAVLVDGRVLLADADIALNARRRSLRDTFTNRGGRAVHVGSHYHFAETNAALDFDRAAARGFRLNIAAGTAVRFEPGQSREVELVALAGGRIVYGFSGAVMGALDATSSRKARPTTRGSTATRR